MERISIFTYKLKTSSVRKYRSLVEEGSNPNIEFERAQQIESEMNVLIRRMELETEGLKKFRHNVETLGRKVKTYKLLEKKHPKK